MAPGVRFFKLMLVSDRGIIDRSLSRYAKRRAAAALAGSRPVALAPPARLRHRPRGEGTGATKSQDDGETAGVEESRYMRSSVESPQTRERNLKEQKQIRAGDYSGPQSKSFNSRTLGTRVVSTAEKAR